MENKRVGIAGISGGEAVSSEVRKPELIEV